jgi:signal transduction histidine kinase
MNVAGMLGQPKIEVIRSCENLADPLTLGPVFFPSPEVSRVIAQVGRSDSRIWVVDSQHRIIAHNENDKPDSPVSQNVDLAERSSSNGNVIEAFVSVMAPLVRPILNVFLNPGTYQFTELPSGTWQLKNNEINIALEGDSNAQLYMETSNSGGGRISAAAPVQVGNTVVGAVFVEETTNKVLAMRYQTVELLIGFILLILLGYVVLQYLLIRNAVNRLEDLAKQTQNAFDANGKFIGQIKPQESSDEIGMLSRSLSSVSVDVRNYTQYLENLSRRLSHELKTPIAIARGSLEMFSKTDNPKQGQVYIERAADGVRRLDNLVTRMSEASDLEASFSSEEKEAIDLCELVTVSIEDYRSAYEGQEFTVVFAESPLRVNGSAEAFRQMLDKLIDNANEFSKAESSIDIALSLVGNDVLLQVTNQGPIIPVESQAQIFDSMVSDRAHSKDVSDQSHLGQGLYVVKLVAQFHEGSVSVRNRPNDDGVTFEVSVPHLS